MTPLEELREELTRLRTAMARRLREKLEAPEGVTPAYMDVARKFLSDQEAVLAEALPDPEPPVVLGLPFSEPDDA